MDKTEHTDTMKHNSKRGFTLVELLIVIAILGILTTLGLGSFMSTQRKSRDNRRKADLKGLSVALETYFNDKGRYPGDNGSGRINVCGALENTVCEWGDTLADANGTIYMTELPEDPAAGQYYFYDAQASNSRYVLYARLENTEDKAVQNDSGQPIVYSGIYCGTEQCNYYEASPNVTEDLVGTVILDPDP